jgi:outer membrane receptor protein involved in Fe transport
MRIFLLVISIFCLLSFGNASEKGIVQGFIHDVTDHAPLIGVNVSVLGTTLGTTSDYQGFFQLKLPPGEIWIQFSMIGYELNTRRISIIAGESIQLEQNLKPKPLEFSGVVVTASRMENAPTSRTYLIDQQQVKNLPPLGEPDILRAIQTLPGIINPNDLRSEFYVRGGNADQNLILLDGVEIYYPYHLFGIMGTFNLNALEGTEVFIGNFPVNYGGRISSVLEIQTQKPRNSLVANISLISSNVVLNRKWQKASVLLALRKTYIDFITPINYGFIDGHFKAICQLKPFQISFSTYFNEDRLNGSLFGNENIESANGEGQSKAVWGNLMNSVRMSWIRKNHLIRSLISYEKYSNSWSSINTQIADLSMQLEYEYSGMYHSFMVGTQTKNLKTVYFWNDMGSSGNDIKEILIHSAPPYFNAQNFLRWTSAFIREKFKLGPKLHLDVGLRTKFYANDQLFAPRIGVTIQFPWNQTLKINAGRYYQLLAYGETAREGSISNLLFETKKPISGDTFSMGYDGNLHQKLIYMLEFYFRNLKNITQFKGEFPDMESGTCKIGGVDVLLRRDVGDLTFQMTYSFLYSQADFNQEKFALDWECRHTACGAAGYQLTKNWYFNCFVSFHSGLPITPPVAVFEKLISLTDDDQPYRNQKPAYILGKRNSERLASYLRCDVSIRKKFHRTKFDYVIYLQILNLLNRGNPVRYDWDAYFNSAYRDEEGNLVHGGFVKSLPIIPSIGVQFEF